MGWRNIYSLIALPVLIFLLLMIAPAINAYNMAFSLDKGVYDQDMIYRLIGESRRIFSRVCMMRADEYFHGGVTLAAQKCKSGVEENMNDHDAHGHDASGHDAHGHDAHEHAGDPSAFKQVQAIRGVPRWNFLLYLGELINIDKHMHLSGAERKEMVPWYVFATQLDPHNIHAYVIGGYWIGSVLKKPEAGIDFLSTGLRRNPDAWKLYVSLGQIYLQEKHDHAQALRHFQKAASLFTEENVTRHESWQVYLYIAACHEWLGNKEKALISYKNILKYFPDDPISRKKVEELSR